MSSQTIPAELVYTWKSFNLIKLVDYGVSFETLLAENATLPPEGARFDAYFDGTLDGPKLKGTISCVDYIHVRSDGRIQLHIHGEITTDDGEKDLPVRRRHLYPQRGHALLPQRERDSRDLFSQILVGQPAPAMGQR